MTEQQLKAIRDRAGAATPGPWTAIYYRGTCLVSGRGGDSVCVVSQPGIQPPPDADFIAHARADVPALLAMVDELVRDLHDLSQDKGAILAAARRRGRAEVADAVTTLGGHWMVRSALSGIPHLPSEPQTHRDLLAENARMREALEAAVGWVEERAFVGDVMPPWRLSARLALEAAK